MSLFPESYNHSTIRYTYCRCSYQGPNAFWGLQEASKTVRVKIMTKKKLKKAFT